MNNNLKSLIGWVETSVSPEPKNNIKRLQKAIIDLNINLEGIKKVHVAGTNGKGSVSKYLTQILTDQGYKTGTFISPYLIKFNERFLINNKEISDKLLEKYLLIIKKYNDTLKVKMSFFELITLLAFKLFSDLKLDVIIIEVGIGGKLDVTNAVNYDLSLLTNIGHDHLKRLGPTMDDVLLNKLGILKENGSLITTIQKKYHNKTIKYALRKNAYLKIISKENKISSNPLKFKYENETYELKMIGDYQIKNAILAIEASKFLYPDLNSNKLKRSLKNSYWPGRLEKISANPTIFIDGAHNIEALKEVKGTFKNIKGDKKLVTVLSILKEKDIDELIKEAISFSDKVILTSFNDFRIYDINKYYKKYPKTIKIETLEEVIKYTNQNKDNLYLFTGSIHFIGYFKKYYLNLE